MASEDSDWFRSREWSEESQQDFEARLARARAHNRPQYMRIKGLALAEAGKVEVARGLWRRVLEDGSGCDFERASALEHLGDSYASSDPKTAEAFYRQLLAEHPGMNGTTHTVEISLAELLLDRKDTASVDEAVVFLRAWAEKRDSPFPHTTFRWHLALIRAAELVGDVETVRKSARTALELAEMGPVFPRHGDVGVVRADRKTLKRLRMLAR